MDQHVAQLDLSLLPTAVLVSILQRVPLAHRLSSCAAVNSQWAAAAAAATTSITAGAEYTRRLTPEVMNSLMLWLGNHGSFVTNLAVATTATCLLSQLPCRHLRDLSLTYSKVQLGPSSSSPGLLHAPTKLTRLQLFACEVVGGPGQLTALAALPDLQHLALSIRGPTLQSEVEAQPSGVWGSSLPVPGILFLQLQQLTHLFLYAADAATFQHFSCLARLQELHLRELSTASAAGLTALQALTQLTLLAVTQADFPVTLQTVPSISALTAVHTLQLSVCRLGVHPGVLLPLTQLREIDISSTELLGGAAGTSMLLAWLPKLHHLTHLALSGSPWGGPLHQPDAAWTAVVPPQAYSALTGSSQLQHLELSFFDLPAAAWEHMFPEHRQLPCLRTFRREQRQPSTPKISSEELGFIVRCCSNLQSLQLPGAVGQGASLQPLLQLSGLQELQVDSTVVQLQGPFLELLQLTGLTALQLSSYTPVAGSLLWGLTSLKRLHRLEVDFTGWSFRSKAPEGFPPDVWKQLADSRLGMGSDLVPDFVNLRLL